MNSGKLVKYVFGIALALVGGIILGLTVRHFFFADTSNMTYEESLGTATPNCIAEGREDLLCYDAFYTDFVLTQGITPAFDDLKTRYKSTASVQGECHQITHAIGRAAAKRSGGVGEAFSEGDAVCWSGYYHGVMEGILDEVGIEALPAELNGVCSTIEGKEEFSFSYYNCVHGLGHGIMQLYENDVPESLAVCSTLDGDWEQSSCAGGVFMENIMIEDRGGVSEYLKADDPVYPCNAVAETHKPDCYMMQTSHMLTALDNDFSKVFAICDGVEIAHRGTCYQSAGRDASGRSISDVEQTKATCMLGRDTFAQENCVVGAVKDFVSYFNSDAKGYEFCASLRPDLAQVCRGVVVDYYAAF
jgi:hypothetical protein